MKKSTLLDQPLSAAIAAIGHSDTVALVDAGYAVPRGADRIDLALAPGVPDLWHRRRPIGSERPVRSVAA